MNQLNRRVIATLPSVLASVGHVHRNHLQIVYARPKVETNEKSGMAGAGGGPYRLPVLSRGRRPTPTREVLEGGKVLRGSPLEGGHHQ